MSVSLRSLSVALGTPVALAALLLAGCAAPADSSKPSDGSGASADCVQVPAGEAVEAITVDQSDGTAPQASFSAPLTVNETQRLIITKGSGDEVRPGDVITVDVSFFGGTSGQAGFSTGHGLQQSLNLIVDEQQTLTGFVRAAACTHVGDRVLAVLSAGDAFGETGNANFGIQANEPVVLIMDILGFDGPDVAAEWDDAPEVDFSQTPPAFTLEGAPEPELRAHTITNGDGPVVRYGQTVMVNYVGKSWDTGEVFDESYSSEPRPLSTTGVVEGFASAIVGHKVGSTVIVTMPPHYGFGPATGSETDHMLAGQTLVFVLEILEVVAE